MILDKDGQKMSKSKGNTLDPIELFDKYGADAVRFYSLFVSPPWVPTRFDEDGLKEVNSKFFRTIKNVYAMFSLYANTNGFDPSDWEVPVEERPEIDRWLVSRYNSLLKTYEEEMEVFEYTKAVRAISDFVVEDLSNWYIRRNRRRFWSAEETPDVKSVFRTTWEVLYGLAKIVAPITPFLAEELYRSLTLENKMDSVHLELLDEVDSSVIDAELENKMDLVRKIVNLGRASREEAGIKVRQPLKEIVLDKKYENTVGNLTDLIKEELNVKGVVFSSSMSDLMEITLKPDYKVAGRVLGAKIKAFAKELNEVNNKEFVDELNTGSLTMELNGENTEILPEYVAVTYLAKEGFDIAMDAGISVVLDTVLDEDLIAEGYMREFISKVQQQRKSNGYEVSDRINIEYAGDDEVAKAFEEYREVISSETLALSMERRDTVEGTDIDINGHEVALKLEKVER